METLRLFALATIFVLMLIMLASGLLVFVIWPANDEVHHRGPVSAARADARTVTGKDALEANDDESFVPNQSVNILSVQPGLVRPLAVPADQASFPDNEEVIGIVVGSKARAYRLRVMRNYKEHVINDVLNGIPVSVVYCNVTQCITAYSSSKTNDLPLDLDVAGWHNKELALKIGSRLFYQRSGEPLPPGAFSRQGSPSFDSYGTFPYPSYPFERTIWKQWKEAHPDTDVHWTH